MNLTHLQFVQSVAETASFSRAAEKCHITQSSLSNAVSQMEDLLGARIFARTTRKVEITPFGKSVLPLIANVLNAVDELSKGARECLNPSYRIVRIGLTPLIDARMVASAVDPFRRSHPNVELFFKECYLNDLQKRLLDGSLDFAFQPSGPADKRFRRILFHQEQLFVLATNLSSRAKTGAGPLRLQQVASETFALTAGCGLADATRRIFRKERIKLREYPGQALSYKVLEDWADLGVAAAVLPESRVSAARIAHPLHDSNGPVRIQYEMAWSRKTSMPKHVTEFLAYFQKTAKQIVGGMASAIAN